MMQSTSAATISYTCQQYDTLPGIASSLYAQTGYGDFPTLIADIMTVNPQIQDWLLPLTGLVILIPTTGR